LRRDGERVLAGSQPFSSGRVADPHGRPNGIPRQHLRRQLDPQIRGRLLPVAAESRDDGRRGQHTAKPEEPLHDDALLYRTLPTEPTDLVAVWTANRSPLRDARRLQGPFHEKTTVFEAISAPIASRARTANEHEPSSCPVGP